jgi:diaminopimelate decarboxylase
MDVFNRRISLDEAAAIAQCAHRQQLLDGASSAVVHHFGLMRARLDALRAAFPAGTLHTVAVKANPVVGVLREAVKIGAGLEAASIEEVELARAAGCAAERIVFDSPAKTRWDIEQALRWGVYLNADNFDELGRIGLLRQTCESTSLIGLRVNAMVGDGTIAHTSVSLANSKFGVPIASKRRDIVAAFARYEWLTGLHVHVGSQGCSLSMMADAVELIACLRREIMMETGRTISQVDIGGGLSTVYRTNDVAPTPAEYCEQLQSRVPELFESNVQLITEFGRAIHANCGLALSRVEYVKRAQKLAVIHLGADFLVRPTYRPDDWKHEFFAIDAKGLPKSCGVSPTTIAGPLCFAGDIVAREIPLPTVEPDDWIVIRDVGAYTLSMWSRHCSRGIPAVLGFDPQASEQLRVLRSAESPADVVKFWS